MIRCVLFGSVALHAAVFAALPSAPANVARPVAPPSLIEVANDVPPPPPPPPPPVPSAIETSPVAVAAAPRSAPKTVTAARTSDAVSGDGPAIETTPAPIANADGPVDFTSTVLSSAVVAAKPSAAPPSPAIRMVPVSSLSRRPGAPGLDGELERNYPIDARRAGISGTAKLRVQILSDGRVGKVERASESFAGFGDACMRTVRAARWDPPLDADGRAVATEIIYVCKFEVR